MESNLNFKPMASFHKKSAKKSSSNMPKKHVGNRRPDVVFHPLGAVNAQILVRRKILYLCGTANATNQQVTVAQLGSMLPGFMAITTVLGGFLTNQFRIRKISLWSPPPVQGSNTANSLKFGDTFNLTAGVTGPSQMTADVSIEPDRPAYCAIRPEPGTVYDWFQTINSTNVFFVFTAPLGSFLEFSFEHYIDDSGTISTGPTIVAATPGVIYHKIVTLSQGMVLSPHSSINGI
jgi:hypothetical protein